MCVDLANCDGGCSQCREERAEKEYTIECRVTLAGALMVVKASSPGEALRKAKENQFEDIEYHQAELIDWEVTGTLPQDSATE